MCLHIRSNIRKGTTMIRFLVAIVLSAIVAATLEAQSSWPQFRGPDGSGVITGKVLPPDTWNAKENLAWKVDVPGHGWSSPIIVAGRVFVTSCVSAEKVKAPKTGYYAPFDAKTHKGEHRWLVICLDAETGKVLWE